MPSKDEFDASMAKLTAIQQKVKQDRAEKWEKIQCGAPDLATFMTAMSKDFDAKAVKVVIDGERIL